MNSKQTLTVLVVLFVLINTALVLAASEPYKNFHSAFSVGDFDPDLDNVSGNDDKCPGSPFDLYVINKNSKKQNAVIPFTDAKGKAFYLRLKGVHEKEKDGDNNLVFQTSTTEKFGKKGLKEYTAAPDKIIPINDIGKRLRVLYSNASKGIAVVWVADFESKKKGCVEAELGGAF